MFGKKTLIIGATTKLNRYAYIATRRLLQQGIDVVAIGVREGQIANVSICTGKPYFKNIDTVSLYINPSIQKEYYEYIVKLKPNRVIFNPGTENDVFKKILEDNNISAEYTCTLVLLSTGLY
ncbi:MAG: CoA-binding protein [Flavobacteriales bacterium]|nr:MAG: CoA-binding protein [Flavobacteriales bacterium]